MKTPHKTIKKSLEFVFSRIEYFFLKPASPVPIAALRIGISAVLLAQAWMLRTSTLDLFAHNGLVQTDVAQILNIPYTPKISSFVNLLAPFHMSEAACIFSVCWAYVASLMFLFFGFQTRLASIAAWFLHWTLTSTSNSTTYGIDLYAHVFLFYLMWMPCGDVFSLDSIIKKSPPLPTEWARLGLRVLQLHLCITYLCSAYEKAQGIQWWNGELLWRALTLPEYRQFDMNWIVNWPFLLKVGGWGTLLMEAGYCIFIWPRFTRKIWVLGVTGMHLGIAIFLGLGLFGSIMCVLTLCVFGFSAEPKPIVLGEPLTA